MYLDSLRTGDKARILEFVAVNDMLKRRLIDMGIKEGSEICMKSCMPFGGPCMITANDQCVSIRRKEAHGIKVES
ncbi:FeoA family protein [Bacillus marinisedimentorum]|uniref:FeoA family protein n=1 Tax=Bacillus marinisedimentorum TaxID=1821260 RepID=UPI000872260E|nr:FeoA family protein [Bacillus marinisedimentorum]